MKHATATLEGALLDQAVAMALGLQVVKMTDGKAMIAVQSEESTLPSLFDVRGFSTDWRFGGPLIERHKISITERGPDGWVADCRAGDVMRGPTPLIAAMRALVASKLGDEVEL